MKKSLFFIVLVAALAVEALPIVEPALEKRLVHFLIPVFYAYGSATIVQTLKNKLFPEDKSMNCVFDYATHIKDYPTTETPAFYNECCFQDDPIKSDVGEFELASTPLGAGKLSGVVVPAGYKVTLFKGPNYQGDKLELIETSVSCLRAWKDSSFNDSVQSIKVEKLST